MWPVRHCVGKMPSDLAPTMEYSKPCGFAIKPLFNPACEPYLVQRQLRNGDWIQSETPFARRGSRGEYVTCWDDAVADANGTFMGWRVWDDGKTYAWSTPAAYDDFPLRAPNGDAVADASEFELTVKLHPPCNGHGTLTDIVGSFSQEPGVIVHLLGSLGQIAGPGADQALGELRQAVGRSPPVAVRGQWHPPGEIEQPVAAQAQAGAQRGK